MGSRLAPFALVVLLAPAFAGCLQDDLPPVDVLATIYPLGFLAERLAGNDLTTDHMVPGGVEAHDWDPSARQIDRIAQSGMFLHQGGGFEAWTGRVLRSLGDDAPPIFDVAAELDVGVSPEHVFGEAHDTGEQDGAGDMTHGDDEHEGDQADDDGHGHGAADPHTWLDPVLFAETAHLLADAMADRFPSEAAGIFARRDTLVADLEALHRSFLSTLADCRLDVIVVSHDAYGHMARRYGFRVAAVSGLSPEAEPDPRTLDRLVRLVRDNDIPIVFFEETVDPSVIKTIARETGAETRVLSPLETLLPSQASQDHDYLSLMALDRDNLRDALECR